MSKFTEYRIVIPHFVGRKEELLWLHWHHSRSAWSPIFVTGAGGVGKTMLLRQFFSLQPSETRKLLWCDLYKMGPNAQDVLSQLIEETAAANKELFDRKQIGELSVVIDGADSLSTQDLDDAIHRIRNNKALGSLIISSRRNPSAIDGRNLYLGGLSLSESTLLSNQLRPGLTPDIIELIVREAHGYPLAISLILGLGSQSAISKVLGGELYEFETDLTIPPNEIIATVRPKIISTTESLIQALKKQPENIYEVSPRQFEKLLAELLADLGFEVEVTKATGDGGKDILAYLETEVGKMLCLVEAKKYRPERKIGIEIVRTLYGTLCDFQANSAMLVTTSSFTAGAHEFQRKHEYQLALRDYADIVRWIEGYRQKG